jgi:hypothetical protein
LQPTEGVIVRAHQLADALVARGNERRQLVRLGQHLSEQKGMMLRERAAQGFGRGPDDAVDRGDTVAKQALAVTA